MHYNHIKGRVELATAAKKNYRVEKPAKEKHSSLFCQRSATKKKSFTAMTRRACIAKLFIAVINSAP
jgi:hypothetical protein